MTKRRRRFLEQFCTASSSRTLRPVLVIPEDDDVDSSFLESPDELLDPINALVSDIDTPFCEFGGLGSAVISTTDIDSLLWKLFFTPPFRLFISPLILLSFFSGLFLDSRERSDVIVLIINWMVY